MDLSLAQFLGGISPEVFMEEYWQKRPLFVKGAFSNTDELASAEDLMEMAQDGRFETRMVWEAGGSIPWEARLGPFKASDFTKNDRDKWTLIVHNLEVYFEEFHQIKKLMNFVPSWKFDDIMSTYSVKGASVGAHIDNYNVFIFQGKGKRQWLLNQNPDETYVENLAIKLLAHFKAEQEYILEEGDLLYLPPGVAHHGITLEESISYSIGFKSFDYTSMALSFLGDFSTHYNSSKCLIEKNSCIPRNVNEISKENIDDVMNFFLSEVLTRENVTKWYYRYITAPREEITCAEVLTSQEISQEFFDSTPLYRDNFLRFNFAKEEDMIKLVVNQHEYLICHSDYQVLEGILETPGFEAITLRKNLSKEVKIVLDSLIKQGALFFSNE